uniref:Uncharacterized protein n=1 Tax=Fagus sylvatica TaxID=28930 RepID=A0A2N9EF89_FAGSY
MTETVKVDMVMNVVERPSGGFSAGGGISSGITSGPLLGLVGRNPNLVELEDKLLAMQQPESKTREPLLIITEERDKLRNLLNEFKRLKNDEAGDEIASGTLVQELESSLVKKELCIKELESSFHVQKEVNTRQYEEIKLLNERLNNEARRIKSLEREGDWLRSKVSLLESSYNSSVIEVCNIVNQNPIQCKIQL